MQLVELGRVTKYISGKVNAGRWFLVATQRRTLEQRKVRGVQPQQADIPVTYIQVDISTR
jgi:hypothetical protein